MPKSELAVTWVVYLKMMSTHGKHTGMSVVCSQSEWDAMELLRPGCNTLIQSGIANEAQAEMLARDHSGYVDKYGRKIPGA